MKKMILFLAINFFAFCSVSYSQTKEEASDMKFIKTLFKRLHENKINIKDTLLWTYIYSDTSLIKLQSLARTYENYGLTVDVLIKPSKTDANKKELTISEERTYTIETLYQRWRQLNSLANEFDLTNYKSKVSGETRPGEIATVIYKPVGR